jgi:hypothetical protein
MPKTATKFKAKERQPTTPDSGVLPPATMLGKARPITKAELCEWMQASPKYIEAEVSRGNLRVLRMSNKMIRFAWSDIEAWLASKAV